MKFGPPVNSSAGFATFPRQFTVCYCSPDFYKEKYSEVCTYVMFCTWGLVASVFACQTSVHTTRMRANKTKTMLVGDVLLTNLHRRTAPESGITLVSVGRNFHSIGSSHRRRRASSCSRALCAGCSMLLRARRDVWNYAAQVFKPRGNKPLSISLSLLPIANTAVRSSGRKIPQGFIMRPLLALLSVPSVLAFLSGGGLRPSDSHAYTRRRHVSTPVKASSGSYPEYVPAAVSEIEEPVSEERAAVVVVWFCCGALTVCCGCTSMCAVLFLRLSDTHRSATSCVGLTIWSPEGWVAKKCWKTKS